MAQPLQGEGNRRTQLAADRAISAAECTWLGALSTLIGLWFGRRGGD
jgi:hypothetical protein